MNEFTVGTVPMWTCPTCNSGKLITDKSKIQIHENVDSIKSKGDDAWEPEWISGGFVGTLKCNNLNCGEIVLVIGEMYVKEAQERDDEENWYLTYPECLYPKLFIPALDIFNVHIDVPDKIKEAILESFKLYWADIASCANKIRIVVELIMDDQKVAKTNIQKGKKVISKLHYRIELFKNSKPDEAELLMAIKWIGNSGSHTNNDLTKDDILDGYEILQSVTTKLYEKDTHRLKKLSKKINKTRKPIGAKRVAKRK